MTISTLNYSTFNESFFERMLTKMLSTPKIGAILPKFVYGIVTPMYANLLLEFTGFKDYAHQMDENTAKDYIKRFTKIYSLMLVLKNNSRRNTYNSPLIDIVNEIVEKMSENLELLEEIANPHFSYQISVNNPDNDWNDSLNDHWDNY